MTIDEPINRVTENTGIIYTPFDECFHSLLEPSVVYFRWIT